MKNHVRTLILNQLYQYDDKSAIGFKRKSRERGCHGGSLVSRRAVAVAVVEASRLRGSPRFLFGGAVPQLASLRSGLVRHRASRRFFARGFGGCRRGRGIAAPRLASIFCWGVLTHSSASLRSGLQRHRASRRFFARGFGGSPQAGRLRGSGALLPIIEESCKPGRGARRYH